MTSDTNKAIEAAARALVNCMNYSSDYGPEDWAEACIDAYLAESWQPIETAPKDGTPIVVQGGTVEWHNHGGYVTAQGGWFSHSSQRYLQWSPKVWQPLPAPPAITQEDKL